MTNLSSIFASPNTDNFQDLMRKNFKKGVKSLTQVSFVELETGHYDLFNAVSTDNPKNLDVEPKYIKDFTIVGFDIEVYFGDSQKGKRPTLMVAGAGEVSPLTQQFLEDATQNSYAANWVEQLTEVLEKAQTTADVRSIYESLVGEFVVFVFKDGELFVFSSGKQLRTDNRMNLTATSLAFSRSLPERALIKIDPVSKKLYPILTF